jgi:EmrB/QacA subfamily drug resistance transporter
MAQFVLVLDVAIVGVALPSIRADLDLSPENLQLVVTTYALTFGGLLLLGGRIADLLGRRRVFVSGLALFTLASLACGLAGSEATLLAARLLQGGGAALVAPAALSLLTAIFPEGETRNRALGVWSAVAAGGGAAGLLLGGVLTDLAGWRWVFLVNVPVGIVVVAVARRVLPESRPAGTGRIDAAGAVAATAGLMALVYGLGRGGQEGFGDRLVLALLPASVALLAAFVAIERRAAAPLVPFGLFRLRTLVGANLATFLMSGVVLGVNFFLTLHFQEVLAYSPIETGLAFLPMTLVIGLASGAAARLVDRTGARPLLLGGMLALAGGSVLLSRLSADGSYAVDVLPGLLLVAVGLGPGFTIGTLAATAGVPAGQQGVASGVLNTSQQVGGAVGLAALAAVASAATGSAAGSTPAALTDGFAAAFLVAGGFAVIAAGAAGALVRERDCRAELARRGREASGSPAAGIAHTAPCQPAITRMATGEP